jgi:hypothetical protein
LINNENPPPKPQFAPINFTKRVTIKRELTQEFAPNVQFEELQAQLKAEQEEKRKLHVKLQKKIKKNKILRVSRRPCCIDQICFRSKQAI